MNTLTEICLFCACISFKFVLCVAMYLCTLLVSLDFTKQDRYARVLYAMLSCIPYQCTCLNASVSARLCATLALDCDPSARRRFSDLCVLNVG